MDATELTPSLYSELRRLAAGCMRRERQGHTLQPTALVHEAYLRLVGRDDTDAVSRSRFFGLAGHVMRQVLVDHVRRRGARKRGGDRRRVTLSVADVEHGADEIDLIALDDALTRLEQMDKRKATLVEMRFFGSMSVEQAALCLGISTTTAEGDWRVARAWLRRELAGGGT